MKGDITMTEKCKRLMNEILEKKWTEVYDGTNGENSKTFQEAVKLTELISEVDKSMPVEEKEEKKKFIDYVKDLLPDIIKVGVIPLGLLVTKFFMQRSNMKLVGEIEQYETPVTTPGKIQHRNMVEEFK